MTPAKANQTSKTKTAADYENVFARIGVKFYLNLVLNCKEVDENINGKWERKRLTDDHLNKIKKELYKKHFYDRGTIDMMIGAQAYENQYHPIKNYLTECGFSYDGKKYIQQLSDCFLCSDGLFSLWLRKWLIAAVAKVFEGAQCPMLVLDGPQGIGKSLFTSWLCSDPKLKDYFYEGSIDPDNKDCKIRLTSKWVWEVSELGSTTRRADIDALKTFLTMRDVTERRPYGTNDEKRQALSCFIGTVNDASTGVLSDPSGTRRFLVSHLDSIDWDYSKNITPAQIWGEAYVAYKTGESWTLTPDERKKSETNNEKYKTVNPIELALEEYFDIDPNQNTWWVSTWFITKELKEHGIKLNDFEIQKQIAEVLKAKNIKKGYQNRQNRKQGYFGIQRNLMP